MNFVLYEDEEEFVSSYEEVINRLMAKSKMNYKIIKINKYSQDTLSYLNSISGSKVYILDVEVPGKNGIDLARMIRKSVRKY